MTYRGTPDRGGHDRPPASPTLLPHGEKGASRVAYATFTCMRRPGHRPELAALPEMTMGAEAPTDSHSVYRTAMSSAGLKRPLRNAHRWRLFARITSVASRAACSPSVTLSKPVHPRSGGGGGNRTRVQNASGLPELRPCEALWALRCANSRPRHDCSRMTIRRRGGRSCRSGG